MTRTSTRTARARDQITEEAADASIEQACRILRLPTIRDRFGDQAAAAARQQATYKSFLSELLFIECEDREVRRKARLVKQAGFPRTKRIEDFDFAANPHVPPVLVHTLAKGSWIRAGQPVCLIGDSGTGKTALLRDTSPSTNSVGRPSSPTLMGPVLRVRKDVPGGPPSE